MPSSDSSKLYRQVPRPVPREIGRASLIDLLRNDEAALIAVIAPGGYGKTTLLAQCARLEPGRAVWLSLREDDADPLTLCGHLASAVQDVLPTLPLGVLAGARAGGAGSAALAAALADDLARSTTNIDLFLDGTDVLQGAAEQWLGQLIDRLPEGHRVILAGRMEPAVGLPQRVAAGTARLLGPAQLAFTLTETAARLGQPAHDEELAALHGHLEGWPIGVGLVASGVAPTLTPGSLLGDVLGRLPRPLREALPEASLLDVWTEAGAAEADLALPRGWLRELRRAGLPLVPQGDAFRPHQLLRDWLDAELRARPDRHAALHRAAGERAEGEGRHWSALEHYRRAGDSPAQLRVARELALTYEGRWEHRLVRQVLEALPADRLPPPLRALLGHALLETGDADRGEALLRDLHAGGERSPGLLFSLGVLAARAGRPRQQLELVEEALAGPHGPRDASRLRRLHASALLALGRADEAVAVGQEALALARDGLDRVEVGAVLTVLQVAHRQIGDLTACEAALRWAAQLYDELGTPTRALPVQNDLADLLREQGRTDEALAVIRPALIVAQREHSVLYPLLLETRADVLFDQGHHSAAVLAYQDVLRHCDRFGLDTVKIRVLPHLTEAALLADQLPEAQRAAALARLLADGGSGDARAAHQFCQGLLARARGDGRTAAEAFSRVETGGFGAPESLAQRAALLVAQGRVQEGTFGPEEARRLEHRLPATASPFLAVDTPALALVGAACRRAGIPVTALEGWAARTPGPARHHGPPDVVPLRLQTLGGPRVWIGDTPVHIPLRRSLEVLVWLALNGEATRDTIVGELWDDSRETRHVEYFKVAVRHLRLALAAHPDVTFNPLPFEQGRYRLSEHLEVELDTAHVARALREPTGERLQAALAAYRGPFLLHCEADWAAVVRTDVLERTLSAGLTLAGLLEQEDSSRAAAVYERCLEIDPLHEDSHLRLIRLWARLGEQEAARRSYVRYRRMLEQEWGRLPEPALAALLEPP